MPLRLKFSRLFLTLALILPAISAFPRMDDMNYDIVVYGGSFSAPAAALAAARTSTESQILLIEPMDWLGGQATAQGVAAIDNAWHNPAATIMRTEPWNYYPADYLNFLDRLKNKPAEAPGEGMAPNGSAWVSREAFDPRTGAWLLEQMIAEQPNITLMKMTVVKDVETTGVQDQYGDGRIITLIKLIQRVPKDGYKPFDKFLSQEILDWYDPAESEDYAKIIHEIEPRDPARGLVVIDASELADVIILSGAVYTVGRELTTEKIADDGTLPDYDEDGSQSFVFPFCMATTESLLAEEPQLKADFPDFESYYQTQVNNFFSMGSHSWNRIWTYRRLKNTGALHSYDTVNPGDVSMQNWYPGNDYPYGTLYKDKAGADAEIPDWKGGVMISSIAEAEMHAVGWYFFMKERKTVEWDTIFPRGDHPMNMMGTATGLARFPYIRCGRRIVGLDNFRITERYFRPSNTTPPTSFRFYDSVGIGCYAEDIHPTKISSGLWPTVHTPAPFYIPLRALGSVNVRNLLACGKQMGHSFLANSAYRLHPIEWAGGSAAGVAAAVMARDGKTNCDLLDLPVLRALQAAVNANSPISWVAYDAEPIPNLNGDLIVNDLKPVVAGIPFQIEIYHHRGRRARVFLNGNFMGETTYRANGRLVLDIASAPTGSANWKAVIYDDDREIDVIDITPEPVDYSIIDNEDARCSFTGLWTRATAQPDKFGPSYHYLWGNVETGAATWLLTVPEGGLYEIAVWYPQHTNRAGDAPFTVHHAGGQTTVPVNQQINGGMWFVLGTFEFDANAVNKVVLTNAVSDTEKLVVADAVRCRRLTNTGPCGWMMCGTVAGR